MKKQLTLLLLSALCLRAQELPNAPTPQPQAAAKCGPWSCWTYPNVPTKEVLKSKSMWWPLLADVALTSLDDEMTLHYEGRPCVEKDWNLPARPTRAQVYRETLPENAAVAIGTFLWLKLKGPKAVLPVFLVWPAYAHIKDSVEWVQCR